MCVSWERFGKKRRWTVSTYCIPSVFVLKKNHEDGTTKFCERRVCEVSCEVINVI
jgi:hypothetical protein